jgi:hypothetical protein
MTTTTKLCPRSGTFPTKDERELTTVFYSRAKQVNHYYWGTSLVVRSSEPERGKGLGKSNHEDQLWCLHAFIGI